MSSDSRMHAVSRVGFCLFLALISTDLRAQESGLAIGSRPVKWSIAFDGGIELPGVLYSQFLERRPLRAGGRILNTRWREDVDAGVEGRLTIRLNPEGGAGLFISGAIGESNSTALFQGGLVPPEQIRRSVTKKSLEVGITLRLRRWAAGRGLLEYHIAPVLHRQIIDLRPGHRDALASFSLEIPESFDWRERETTSWGLSLGTSVRIPIGPRLHFRGSFRDQIVPVNTASLGRQEAEDIEAFSGERVRVSFKSFTAHHLSLNAGIEYTLGWGPPRREIIRRLPEVEETPTLDPEVESAMRLAARGDTAAAIAALQDRVSAAPRDRFAWRELALLRAARAEFDPTVRDQALATLERALNMNPGDTELLRHYGRIRGLVQREGRTLEASGTQPMLLSGLAADVDGTTGGLRLAWAARGLTAAEDGGYRYQVTVEVFRGPGQRVLLRPGMGDLRLRDDGALVMEGSSIGLPAEIAVSVFMVDAGPGIYTARVRLTDLESGIQGETTTGFEIR